jgi:hypothetical protein
MLISSFLKFFVLALLHGTEIALSVLRQASDRVRFSTVATESTLLHSVQTYSGPRPASFPIGTGGPFSGFKATEA